jgi:hypothetical protein
MRKRDGGVQRPQRPGFLALRCDKPGHAVMGYPSVTSASTTSRSAVMILPLVSGPR